MPSPAVIPLAVSVLFPTPDVSDYETERSLAMMSLQQVQSTYAPLVDTELQEYLEGVGERVLDSWPVPLKGYRYRFQVVDSDDVNAFRGADRVHLHDSGPAAIA